MPNTFSSLYVHIVFGTKGRSSVIRSNVRSRLHAYLGSVARNVGTTPLAAGGVADHVHLLIRDPPRISISDLVCKLKANSGKWIHDTFPRLANFAWQDGYAALSVSQSRTHDVRRYVERQEAHHTRRSFAAEWDEIMRQIESAGSVAADAAQMEEQPSVTTRA